VLISFVEVICWARDVNKGFSWLIFDINPKVTFCFKLSTPLSFGSKLQFFKSTWFFLKDLVIFLNSKLKPYLLGLLTNFHCFNYQLKSCIIPSLFLIFLALWRLYSEILIHKVSWNIFFLISCHLLASFRIENLDHLNMIFIRKMLWWRGLDLQS